MTDGSSTSIETPSESSGSPSGESSSSSSPQQSRMGILCATLVSVTCIAIITYAWFSGRLTQAPWWAAPGGIVIAAIPGGAMAGTLSSVGKAAVGGLLERLPGKAGKK